MTSEIQVQYNFLGNSGLKVANIGLGTMTFGISDEGIAGWFGKSPTQLDEASSHKLIDRYVELGGNFIDTADIYSGGLSEKIVGTWLKKQNRDSIIVATKVRFPSDMTNPNALGLSRKWILRACEDSLERLQTDYIDLYQAHLWDSGVPIEETLRAFDDLIRCNKIRYYGFSNICGWQMQKVVETAKRLNISPPVCLQQQYNLMQRHSEWEEFMVCEHEGVGVVCYSPLSGGLLTGKFVRNQIPDSKSSRIGYIKKLGDTIADFPAHKHCYWDKFSANEEYWNLIAVMQNIADKHGKPVTQVALRWLLQRKVVASVLIGATSIQQLEDNMGASSGWELTDTEMMELSGAYPLPNPYPYDMIWGMPQGGRSNPFMK